MRGCGDAAGGGWRISVAVCMEVLLDNCDVRPIIQLKAIAGGVRCSW